MSLPQAQLDVYLNLLRQKGAESRAAYNVEFQAAKDWVNAALEEAISNENAQPPKVHAPKTPVGKSKVALAARQLYTSWSDSEESEVTSTTNTYDRELKIEPPSSEESSSFESSVNNNTVRQSSSVYHNKKKRLNPKESIGANSTYVKAKPDHKESIGANSTYVKGPEHKESIGVNSTYVKESQFHKESIGANSTYVKGPDHKDSIGANSTYVKEGQFHKESIGANSTYVKIPAHKESVGANSTYVKDELIHKESIGANSTYVVQQAKNSKQTDMISSDGASYSGTSIDQSILEASRIAVEEAMKGPDRLTRNKAKAVAQRAAQQAQVDVPVKSNKSRSGEAKAALRQARKSLNRAKIVAIGKSIDCHPGKVWCSHTKMDCNCNKPIREGRLRCVSQTESSSPCIINKHLAVAKIQRTLSHNDLKETTSVGKKILSSAKAAPNTSSNQGNRLQVLAAKTLSLCQKKEPLKIKSAEMAKTKQLEKAVQPSSVRECERVAVKIKHVAKVPVKNNLNVLSEKKVVQDIDSDKASFIKNVANQGLSYLAKPLHLRVQDTNSVPTKTYPTITKSADLPINQTFEVGSYDISLDPNERAPLPSKNENDYGLDDVHSDDSSDDEENPKKVLPYWARAHVRASHLNLQHEISHSQMFTFF
ncbi:hypothetical protein FOCC_FOCC004616, partial [Frankliniella occidentalis]